LFPPEGTGTKFISLSIIVDPAFNTGSTVTMHVFDSEFDPWSENFNGTMDPFVKSSTNSNLYYLANKMYYTFGYSRKFRKTIIDIDSNYVGFRSTYETQKYIESKMQILSVAFPNLYSLVEVSGNNFNIEVEKEQRINTIVSIFGTIAGYYGIMVTFYIFLFGADIINPWGFVHNGCCIFKGLKTNTTKLLPSTMTEIDEPKGRESEDPSGLLSRVKHLERFQSFLEHNLVDTSLINSIKDKKGEKIDIEIGKDDE
jgi:hypothetical protein